MSYVEVMTKKGRDIELVRGTSNGTFVVEIDNAYIFFDSRAVDSLRKFISQEIEKGWIK